MTSPGWRNGHCFVNLGCCCVSTHPHAHLPRTPTSAFCRYMQLLRSSGYGNQGAADAELAAFTRWAVDKAVRLVDDLTAAGLARLGISRQTLDANMLHWLNEASSAYLVRRGRAWCAADAASQTGSASRRGRMRAPRYGVRYRAGARFTPYNLTSSCTPLLPATQFDWGSPEAPEESPQPPANTTGIAAAGGRRQRQLGSGLRAGRR